MGLPTDFLAVINERYRHVRYLLEVDTTAGFRITSGLTPIVYDGDTYTPRGWKPSGITSGDPRSAGFSATIEDIDGDLELTAYQDGWTEGRTATLYILGSLDGEDWVTAWQPITARVLTAQGGHVFFNLGCRGSVGLFAHAGLKVGDSRCRHTYKGSRCKYAGSEATCDRTFDACETRASGDNSANFGGYRAAPAPGTIINLGKGGRAVPTSPPINNTWSGGARRRLPEMMENPNEPPAAVNGGAPPDSGGGTTPATNPSEPTNQVD